MLSRFISRLREYGLEALDLYYGIYTGEVSDINDPEGLGRIRVIVPSIHNDGDEPLPWGFPASQGFVNNGAGYGTASLPRVGDNVWVVFRFGKLQSPVYLNGWWAKGEMPDELNDPKIQGFKTESGHLSVWQDGDAPYVEHKHAGGSHIRISSDGAILIETQDGDLIELKPGQSIEVKTGSAQVKLTSSSIISKLGSSSVKLSRTGVEVAATGDVKLSAPVVTIDGKASVSLGSGASSPLVKGDVLYAFLVAWFTWMSTHTHTAPNVPPTVPPPVPPFSILSFLSRTK